MRRPTVTAWIGRARTGQGIKDAKRGRPLGDGRKLTQAQEERIRKDIVEHKLRFALWSAQAVRTLIKAHFGIDLPVRSVRNHLKRWGFTPQRPPQAAGGPEVA